MIVIFWGIPVATLFNLLSNVMRAVGDSRTPLLFLVIACVINIILDYVFILVFHTGTEGAAYATVIAQLVSGVLCLAYVMKKMPSLRLRREDWLSGPAELAVHARVALPMGFQMSIIAIGTVIIQYALNGLGTTAVAAFTAALKIDQIATLPLSSFGVTMTTYTAQNYGARKYGRIKAGVLQCVLVSGLFSIFMGLLFVFFGRFLSSLFIGSGEKEALDLSRVYLIINGSFYAALALLFIFRQTLQGLGDSMVPTLAGIMELLMRSAAAMILPGPFGFAGICFASPLAWLGACVPLGIAFLIRIKKLDRLSLSERRRYAEKPADL
jgi:putative MATE family efflux protein